MLLDSITAKQCDARFQRVVWGLSTSQGRCYWGDQDVSALNLGNLSASTNAGSLYADLGVAYFGPVRVNIGTLVSSATDGLHTDEEDARAALQRLVAGGGNVVAGFQLPFVHYRQRRANNLRLSGAWLGRVATDVRQLGASEEAAQNLSAATAMDLRIQVSSNENDLQLFAYGKGEFVRGQDPIPAFATQDPLAASSNHLYYGQASFGARLLNTFVVTYTYYRCPQCGPAGVSSQLSVTAQRRAP
jgi:hypothetical protein